MEIRNHTRRPVSPPAAVSLAACLLVLFTALPTFASAPALDIAALLSEAGSAEDYPDADMLVVFDHTDIEVEPSGLSHIVNRRLTKTLTGDGARTQAFQRFDFDPATQLIDVRRVVIHRADGSTETVDTAGLVDVYAPAHAIYWGARMLGLDLPRLQVDDAVEIETYRKGFQIAYLAEGEEDSRYIPPMRGHYYDVVLFQEAAPIVEKTYTLRTPRSMPVQYAVYNGDITASQTFDTEHFIYTFSKQDSPAAVREWRSPGTSDYVPKVVMATVADWGEKSRWFCDVNQRQFDSNPEIDAKVAEITKGLKGDDERIAAINHWVAQNIRYCGLNMGKGEGYTLHPGDMIFRERSGVCKDIAGMSITMLRAAGFEVYPAMTMAGARVERTPADQFNHCVVALRRPDGEFEMLDPTWVPWSRYNWSRAEGEQHYVIGSPEGEDLSAIRSYTPQENGMQFQVEAEIDDSGRLSGTISLETSGYSDTRLRRAVGSSSRDSVVPGLRNWLATLAPGARLVKYRFSDASDWSKAMTLRVEFEIDGYATISGSTMTWAPVASRLVMANYSGMHRFANPNLPEERETPALLWYTQEVTVSESIKVPRGFDTVRPGDDVKAGCPEGAGFCDFTWRTSGRRIDLTGRMQAGDRTVSVARWPDFQEAVTAFAGISDTRMTARRKGGRS